MVNRPYQESSSTVSGSEIIRNNSKTSYNGTYGLNAQWTVYNGSSVSRPSEQEKLNNRAAELDVATSENDIEETITQTYVQILYAAESVKVNESTLVLSQAQYERGKELFAAGSISKADLAQLEAQVSTDRYQLVTAQSSLQDYKLQLKQLLELDGEEEMNLYLPTLEDSNVLSPLPTKIRCIPSCSCPASGNRIKQTQCTSVGAQHRYSPCRIYAQYQSECRYRHNQYKRFGLYFRPASEKRMEQLYRSIRERPHL